VRQKDGFEVPQVTLESVLPPMLDDSEKGIAMEASVKSAIDTGKKV